METNWDDLRLLLAISRRGSFLQAGRTLGMAASTLSRRISQLEEAVGELLVERGVEGCRITERGLALVAVAQAAEEGLQRPSGAAAGLDNAVLSGNVVVTAGEGFSPYVMEAAGRFTSLHRRCSVKFVMEAEFCKVARGAVDIAIRTSHLGEPSLIYRPLGNVAYGIFAAPAYVERAGDGLTAETVSSIALLPPLDALPHMRAARAANLRGAQISVNSFAAQMEAVKRGHGVAVLPRILAGGLIELFPEIELPEMEVFLVTRPQALKQPHIKALFGILDEVLRSALVKK